MLVEYSASVRECLRLVGLEMLNEINLVVSILMYPFRQWNRNFSLANFTLFSMVSNPAFISSSNAKSTFIFIKYKANRFLCYAFQLRYQFLGMWKPRDYARF